MCFYVLTQEIERNIKRDKFNEQKFFIKMRLNEKKRRIEEALQLAKGWMK